MTLCWNASRIGGCELSEPVTAEVQIDHRGQRVAFIAEGGLVHRERRVTRIWEPSRSGGILDGVILYPRTLHTPELKGRCLPGVRR